MTKKKKIILLEDELNNALKVIQMDKKIIYNQQVEIKQLEYEISKLKKELNR